MSVKKKYCECKEPEEDFSNGVHPGYCKKCHKIIPILDFGNIATISIKPIPAEKKECEHEFYNDHNSGDNICSKCGKKEPKPKERIEELEPKDYGGSKLRDKINEIINFINNRKENE